MCVATVKEIRSCLKLKAISIERECGAVRYNLSRLHERRGPSSISGRGVAVSTFHIDARMMDNSHAPSFHIDIIEDEQKKMEARGVIII